MTFSDTTKTAISFKKLVGKANTDTARGDANEAKFTTVPVSASTVAFEKFPAIPSVVALYDITNDGTSSAIPCVEFLRLKLVEDPSSNHHAFFAQLPDAYSTSLNPKQGVAPFINKTVLVDTAGALQCVPPLFGLNYEAKPYIGGTAAQGSGTLVSPDDARNWNFDYFNGVFYQENAAGITYPAPNYIECLVFIGSFVNQSVGAGRSMVVNWANSEGDTKTITHGWGTTAVMAEVLDNATSYQTIAVDSVERTDGNTIVLVANVAPTINYTVLLREVAPTQGNPVTPTDLPVIFTATAGETMAANTTFVVRWALNSETAGRVYKATKDQTGSPGKYWSIGVVQTGPTGNFAGDTITVIKSGRLSLLPGDTNFGATDAGLPLFLMGLPSAPANGSFGTTDPVTSVTPTNQYASSVIGNVISYNSITTLSRFEVCCSPGSLMSIATA